MAEPEGNIAGLLETGEMEHNPRRQEMNIYTAVPYEIFVTGSDGGDDEQETSTIVSRDERDEKTVLRSCKYYSLVLGVLIGAFIQLSCMGAFFLYNSFTLPPNERASTLHVNGKRNQILLFSLVWSGLTSAVGFLFMLILSSLFQRTQRELETPPQNTFLLHMELYVATGAVLGVSLAWTAKNYLLGGHVFFWESFLTFGAALAYAIATNYVLLRSKEEDNDECSEEGDENTIAETQSTDLNKPLLEKKKVDTSSPIIKRLSFILGYLIGSLIQISSLAAHYLVLQASANGLAYQKELFMLFCVVWDFLTSTMGITTLILVRKLLLLYWSGGNPNNMGETECKVLFRIESYFSIGALIGVNLSWFFTDALLGLHFFDYRSLITIAVSTFWCWTVTACGARAMETHEKL